MEQKHINVNEDLTSFGYRKYGLSTNGTQSWIVNNSKSLNDKIIMKQKYINIDMDLSIYGYKRHELSSNGTQKWILASFQKTYHRNYSLNHIEENKKRCKNYYDDNREKQSKYNKEYSKRNEKKLSEKRKAYYQIHKEEIKQEIKMYRHTEKGIEILERQTRKRRNLGFNPLNDTIDGIEYEAHHINKEDIIYIPKIIHQKIYHNLKTGKNMKLINSIAEGFR